MTFLVREANIAIPITRIHKNPCIFTSAFVESHHKIKMRSDTRMHLPFPFSALLREDSKKKGLRIAKMLRNNKSV
jgi:hypothetical protein